jgi:hypothetical protein
MPEKAGGKRNGADQSEFICSSNIDKQILQTVHNNDIIKIKNAYLISKMNKNVANKKGRQRVVELISWQCH